jgi:hypothetical protein
MFGVAEGSVFTSVVLKWKKQDEELLHTIKI